MQKKIFYCNFIFLFCIGIHAGREEFMLTQVAETFFRQEEMIEIIRTLKRVKYVVSHKYFSNISSGEIQRKANLSITCSCHQTTGL
jgi:hypothetical protein